MVHKRAMCSASGECMEFFHLIGQLNSSVHHANFNDRDLLLFFLHLLRIFVSMGNGRLLLIYCIVVAYKVLLCEKFKF